MSVALHALSAEELSEFQSDLLSEICVVRRRRLAIHGILWCAAFLLAVSLGVMQSPPADTWLDYASVTVIVILGMVLLSGMSAGKGQSGAIMIGLAVGGCTLGSGLSSHFGVLWGLVGLIAGSILGSLMASAVVMLLDHLDDELNVLQRQLNRVNAHLQPGVDGSQHNGLSFADRRAMYRFNKAS